MGMRDQLYALAALPPAKGPLVPNGEEGWVGQSRSGRFGEEKILFLVLNRTAAVKPVAIVISTELSLLLILKLQVHLTKKSK
jgi:hypothetical protein